MPESSSIRLPVPAASAPTKASAPPRHTAGSGPPRSWGWGWLRGAVLPVLLLTVWEVLARAGVLPPNLLPAPSRVLATIWQMARTGELWEHLGITLWRVALGFVLGSALATVFGALTGYSRTLNQLLDPLLQGIRNIPSLAWVPLFILWMGIYETSKVVLIAVGVFFPVYLNLMSGIQGVDRKLIEVGRVYRLSGLQLVRRIFLPATLPAYFVGLRSGLGLGWMFVVAAEIMGANKGLGFLLVDGQMTGRPQTILASILLFAVLGQLTDALLSRLSHHLLRWQDTHRVSE
ncbi:MAG: ABC transporter permease [Hymenobacter sp.]|nr:ABC transporter permease [Hymenobacter sp.]